MAQQAETDFDFAGYTRQSRKSWSQVAASYDLVSSRYFRPITQAFIAYAELSPGQRILDVACGSGAASLAAAKEVGDAGRILGVDLAPGMLKLARKRAKELLLDFIDFEEMNAEELALPNDSFDAVICQLGLMLFSRPDRALSEIVRVAKPGGSVACMVQGLRERMLLTGLVMKAMTEQAPQLKLPGAPSLYAFGAEGALEAAFKKAGLARISASRLAGTFRFDGIEHYWDTMTQGGGRTRLMLESLPAETQAAIRAEVFRLAAAHLAAEGLFIPYEFVMAKAVKI
ncbi:MAG: methyltransferase domain-containing protein [Elusimicrobia bacterium]|nr:methyltransferase domain-containing protein [Elusimicrobiota bacterium]